MNQRFKNMLSHIFVAVPFGLLVDEYLDKVVAFGINPELGIRAEDLERFDRDDFESTARTLKAHGLRTTLHAPYMDLSPASADPRIRQASQQRILQVVDLIPVFKPVSVVCHLGYVPLLHEEIQHQWLKRAMEFWPSLASRLKQYNTPLMLENVFERDPQLLKRLLSSIDSPYVRFCLDTGHTLAFSGADWQEWLNALGSYLGQIHAHDNKGNSDEHCALGRGIFPFAELFNFIAKKELKPIVTLEAHSEEGIEESLPYLDTVWPWTK
jgi:sugar phosphate isomerase/epimerase